MMAMPDDEFSQEPGEPSQSPAIEPFAAQESTGTPPPEAPLVSFAQPEIALLEPPKPRPIAPIWHTLILVIGILAFSVWGAVRKDSNPFVPTPPAPAVQAPATAPPHGVNTVRLIRYSLTCLLELAIVGWVILGMHLRNIPFRSLFGAWPHGLNDITREALIAAAFWISSMAILVVLALTWAVVETQVDKYHKAHEAPQAQQAQPNKPGAESQQEKSPDEKQADLIRQLTELAPANGIEIICWGALCLIVGFSEEIVFRGYLQTQSIAVLRKLPVGVVFTAFVFGFAHGYQGIRGVVLISVYGVLFGIITLMRRNLFPGMLAHSWHDFFTGMVLALIRASGLLEHLPHAH
jgi:hypothetical protein